MFGLDEVMVGNDEYIDKSCDSISQLFNNTWICRYPLAHKIVYDKVCEFKRDFTPLLEVLYLTRLDDIK